MSLDNAPISLASDEVRIFLNEVLRKKTVRNEEIVPLVLEMLDRPGCGIHDIIVPAVEFSMHTSDAFTGSTESENWILRY